MKTHYLRTFTETNEFCDLITRSQIKPTITKAEALKLISEIGFSTTKVFKNIVLLVSTRGYIALGFKKPSDCLRKRLPELSHSYISRLITATSIYIKLDPKRIYLNKVSEATFRPLQNISDKDSDLVWKYILNHYEQHVKRINSRHIVKAMNALNIHSREECISNHQTTITVRLDREILPKFNRHINQISNAIRDSKINSKEEWAIVAKLIYQQLLKRYDATNENTIIQNKLL
ncbi:hypothetical protein IVG45_19130 [Methylomonas sp. LL1]|uniref:hypothetical protein n=1 Tax=Methylomonas sp. LL1 TaxID=2785785 RepID=UPI0018C3A482|nr:hypothetical protein [Methylomonas sp. LL1]QPK62916.1 hypothetical protein IVG45_19130 [Methylomonas sp. LL1]